jgi:ABC-2 type transport system ATP-binding protein
MVIDVEDLGKSFGEVEALSDVSFQVKEGEIVGVVGANGAGKSTLMQILSGQLERDYGNVEVLGLDPEEKPVELRKKVGVLPEREDPPSFLTGTEYLDYVSDIRDKDIDTDYWVEELNLEGEMDKLTYNLSKGERQKLMIAQALFHSPELVFIDEPLVNLDPIIQQKAKELFRNSKKKGGTVFLCTHILSLAEELCDRVLFLEKGEISEVVEDPENLKQKFNPEE